MQLYLPTYEIVIDIHDMVIEVSGGKSGLHVNNDIYRAVERPMTYVQYIDDYSIDTICSVLIDSIARYHGFKDGNKRTALMTAMLTYRMNGHHFKATLSTNKAFDELVMWVVTKKPEIAEIEKKLGQLRKKFGSDNEQHLARMINSFVQMRKRKDNS